MSRSPIGSFCSIGAHTLTLKCGPSGVSQRVGGIWGGRVGDDDRPGLSAFADSPEMAGVSLQPLLEAAVNMRSPLPRDHPFLYLSGVDTSLIRLNQHQRDPSPGHGCTLNTTPFTRMCVRTTQLHILIFSLLVWWHRLPWCLRGNFLMLPGSFCHLSHTSPPPTLSRANDCAKSRQWSRSDKFMPSLFVSSVPEQTEVFLGATAGLRVLSIGRENVYKVTHTHMHTPGTHSSTPTTYNTWPAYLPQERRQKRAVWMFGAEKLAPGKAVVGGEWDIGRRQEHSGRGMCLTLDQ